MVVLIRNRASTRDLSPLWETAYQAPILPMLWPSSFSKTFRRTAVLQSRATAAENSLQAPSAANLALHRSGGAMFAGGPRDSVPSSCTTRPKRRLMDTNQDSDIKNNCIAEQSKRTVVKTVLVDLSHLQRLPDCSFSVAEPCYFPPSLVLPSLRVCARRASRKADP